MYEKIDLNIYCDEIKETRIVDNFFGNENWIYFGVLIVPLNLEDELIERLCNMRCGNPAEGIIWGECKPKCQFHKKNNKEIHYQELQSYDQFFIADRWLKFMLKDDKYTFFQILGIRMDLLDYPSFGQKSPTKRLEVIYNRFFRTTILKSVKSYFSKYNKILIHNIFHDNADIKRDYYFPWHSIYKIGKEEYKINFINPKIEFIESDHRISNNKKSHLIQYIDVILGSFFNALHWESKNENKEKVALSIKPLLERIISKPNNKNSHYHYFKRKNVDFFPDRKMTTVEEFDMQIKGAMYKKREIRIIRKFQESLFQ